MPAFALLSRQSTQMDFERFYFRISKESVDYTQHIFGWKEKTHKHWLSKWDDFKKCKFSSITFSCNDSYCLVRFEINCILWTNRAITWQMTFRSNEMFKQCVLIKRGRINQTVEIEKNRIVFKIKSTPNYIYFRLHWFFFREKLKYRNWKVALPTDFDESITNAIWYFRADPFRASVSIISVFFFCSVWFWQLWQWRFNGLNTIHFVCVWLWMFDVVHDLTHRSNQTQRAKKVFFFFFCSKKKRSGKLHVKFCRNTVDVKPCLIYLLSWDHSAVILNSSNQSIRLNSYHQMSKFGCSSFDSFNWIFCKSASEYSKKNRKICHSTRIEFFDKKH